jgi:TorA maturation chaperone TorD
MNEFSMVCRVLGSLFYRQPQDPLLAPLYLLIQEGKLGEQWPLEQNELLARLQQESDLTLLAAEFSRLFGAEGAVSPYGSDYDNGVDLPELESFLQQRAVPKAATRADHFGLLLLAASWLEDHAQADESSAQLMLFETFLLPWCGRFLGKVEAHTQLPFYRVLAELARQAIQAMYDELCESVAALSRDEEA